MLRARACAAVLILVATPAWGAPKPADFDKNHNQRLDIGDEVTTFGLHKVDPILGKYDTNRDGKLDADELKVIAAEYAAPPTPTEPEQLAEIAALQERADTEKGIPLDELAEKDKDKTTLCPGQKRLYVRRDRLDLSAYTGAVSQKEAKGASLSLADDDVADLNSVEAHGVVSFVLTRACLDRPTSRPTGQYLSGWGFAAWTQADGIYTDDDPEKDKSTLKFGADVTLGWFGGRFLNSHYLTLSPYYQTDFRTVGEAYGAQVSWEPYRLQSHLGGTYGFPSTTLDYFFQVRLDGDWLHVQDVGRTALTAGTDYAWLGGTVGLTTFPLAAALDSRAKVYGSWTYHREVNHRSDARLYAVGASYDLTADGAVSISLEHSWGLEHDKLLEVKKTIFSLNFKQ